MKTIEDLIEALGIEGTLQEAINYIAECWDLDQMVDRPSFLFIHVSSF